ncbi:uncharacterized protein METZ01_LOCUS341348 [marine metagenome]|uniref:Uncharacterized protein n=1 Tax=marine metagenome TaxID=408172 RepID=A0A382QSL1_9ZZZZ
MLALFKLVAHCFRQTVDLPNRFQTHVILVQFADFLLQIICEVFHDRLDLRLGTIPILGGKSIQSEVFDPKFTCSPNYCARRLNTATMTLNTGQMPAFCPAAVAIHYNGNMQR